MLTEQPPLQNGDCITIMSSDPRESACKGCGQVRVIYQGHYFSFLGEQVRARCKSCHEAAAAERGGKICIKRSRKELPQIWARDGHRSRPRRMPSDEHTPTTSGFERV
jgi:ribosomal protein S27E